MNSLGSLFIWIQVQLLLHQLGLEDLRGTLKSWCWRCRHLYRSHMGCIVAVVEFFCINGRGFCSFNTLPWVAGSRRLMVLSESAFVRPKETLISSLLLDWFDWIWFEQLFSSKALMSQIVSLRVHNVRFKITNVGEVELELRLGGIFSTWHCCCEAFNTVFAVKEM